MSRLGYLAAFLLATNAYADGDGRIGGPKRKPIGKLEIKRPTVTPGAALDPAVVGRNLRLHVEPLQWCFEKELGNKSSLSATVDVRFAILEAGKATEVVASGVSTEVSSCVARVVGELRHPKPKFRVHVKTAFSYSARSADDRRAPDPVRLATRLP